MIWSKHAPPRSLRDQQKPVKVDPRFHSKMMFSAIHTLLIAHLISDCRLPISDLQNPTRSAGRDKSKIEI